MKLFNDICKFLIKAKQDPSELRRIETEKEADKIHPVSVYHEDVFYNIAKNLLNSSHIKA